jgi:cardiolipin synthase
MTRVGEQRILTLPNVISLARILAIPYFLWLLLDQEEVLKAAVVLIVVGGTDWIDGTLARALNQVTELGKALDPIADRLALAAAVVGGFVAGIVPLSILAALGLRELVMAVAAGYLLKATGGTLAVRTLGKTATALLYASVPSFYLAGGDVAPSVLLPLAWVLGVVGLLLYFIVAVGYLREIRDRVRQA